MNAVLTDQQKQDFLNRGFSRRTLGRIAAVIAGGAVLPFYNEPALAQLSAVRNMPPDAVKINANENPLGPCTEARAAMQAIIPNGGRYMYEETFTMQETMAERKVSSRRTSRRIAGSSAPLHQSVLAFSSPTKPFVIADPGYEQGAGARNSSARK